MRHSPYFMGTVTPGSTVSDPANAVGAYDESKAFTIAIPGIADIVVELARKEPDATEVGTIVFFSPAGGEAFSGGTVAIETWIESLVDAGWRVIQTRWQTPWSNGTSTGNTTPPQLAGRVATIIRYIYDTWVGPNVHNLVLHGGSGGASQIAYAMSHYGLGSIVNKVVLSGGPPHAALLRGCRDDTGLAYDGSNAAGIDDMYTTNISYDDCVVADVAANGAEWEYDSILSGVLAWPSTYYIHGTDDATVGPAHGELVLVKQAAARDAYMNGADHNVLANEKARNAIRNASLERAVIRQSAHASTTGTSLAIGFPNKPGTASPPAVKAGNALVLLVTCGIAPTGITPPADFVLCNDGSTDASVTVGTPGMRCYLKTAVGGETGLSVGLSSSTLVSASLFEVEKPGVSSWAVDKVDLTPQESGVTTLTCGPTGTPSTGDLWCLAAVFGSGSMGAIVTPWTNDFVAQFNVSANRQYSAARSTSGAAAAQSSVIVWTSSRNACGLLVAIKAA